MEKELTDNKTFIRIIYLISILIPVAVGFLIFFPSKLGLSGDWVRSLPGFHAMVNSATVVTLNCALFAVKKGNIKVHRTFMFTSLILGALFLISYVTYHSSVDSVKFGDLDHDGMLSAEESLQVGTTRLIYLIVLASHILLSIVVVPLVLFAFYYSLNNQIDRHKKIVRFTFPIWLYVSITGVIVYLMVKPYYFL